VSSPSYHLSTEEKDLLRRFRFSLVDERRALTKFLLAVYWTVESEVVQVAELLEQWKKRSLIVRNQLKICVIVLWITHPTRQSTKIHGGPTLKGDR
jgi:phosphatidylinositol 3-kinase